MSGLCENDGWSADTLLFLIIGRHTYCKLPDWNSWNSWNSRNSGMTVGDLLQYFNIIIN